MEMSPDTLEAVRVNDLFVEVTIDASFTAERSKCGVISRHIPTRVFTLLSSGLSRFLLI